MQMHLNLQQKTKHFFEKTIIEVFFILIKHFLRVFLAETRSEKAKRKLFRNVTVGAYDGTDGPR